MKHVRQEHANGCGVAVAAMLVGTSYADMLACLRTDEKYAEKDLDTGGLTHYEVDWMLAQHGGYVQRHWLADHEDPWPPLPWAPAHYAMVVQPSGNTHFVAVDGAGRVLDPLRESGIYTLGDWLKVNQVCGVVFA